MRVCRCNVFTSLAPGRIRDHGRGCLVLAAMDSFPLLYSEEYKALRRPRRHDLTMGGVGIRKKRESTRPGGDDSIQDSQPAGGSSSTSRTTGG